MFTDTYRRFIEQDEEAVGGFLYEAEQQHEALEQRLKQIRDQHAQRRSRRDQHEPRRSRGLPLSRWDYVMETMERRYAKGEFGEAANFAIEGYNKAMKQMLDEVKARQWKLPYKRELNARGSRGSNRAGSRSRPPWLRRGSTSWRVDPSNPTTRVWFWAPGRTWR